MPKSKRDKNVSLTKVKKKTGRESKSCLVNEIRQCADKYENAFVFSIDNMRSSKLQSVRHEWCSDSKFFYGKNKVAALALGRIPEEEYKTNLHYLAQRLTGQCGLLFTNKSMEETISYFESYREADYARSGNIATTSVELEAGPLEEFSHAIEPQLRQLGMPTCLQKGVVTLLTPFKVCDGGSTLSPEQAKILKLLAMPTVNFQINIQCGWSKATEQVIDLVKTKKKKSDSQKSKPKRIKVKKDKLIMMESIETT